MHCGIDTEKVLSLTIHILIIHFEIKRRISSFSGARTSTVEDSLLKRAVAGSNPAGHSNLARHRASLFLLISKTPTFSLAGVLLTRVPPLPIPNREVKAREPDDTCCFDGRESRVCRHSKVLAFLFELFSASRYD